MVSGGEGVALDHGTTRAVVPPRGWWRVGDSVACNTGGSFQKGTVISLMYREEGMPPGMVAPYQVKLDNGSLIYAPEDNDQFVRKA